MTCLCVDLAVFSLYCQESSNAKRRFGGRDTNDVEEWFETHLDECNRNFYETTDGMEATAAEIL